MENLNGYFLNFILCKYGLDMPCSVIRIDLFVSGISTDRFT